LKEKIKVNFGKPLHGWLPVSLAAGQFELEFRASDVPENPLYLLVDALLKALVDLESEVWWHLEPDGFYFNFEPHGNEECTLKISYTNGVPPEMVKKVFEIRGDFKKILLPFWRAVREFDSHDYSKHHWPKTHVDDLNKLTRQ
jgi:hypothetical protein